MMWENVWLLQECKIIEVIPEVTFTVIVHAAVDLTDIGAEVNKYP